MTNLDTQQMLEDYERDGAVVVRGVVEQGWIERMRDAVEEAMQKPGDTAAEYTPDTASGRFFGDFFIWLRNPDFSELSRYPRITQLAAQMMRSSEVRFFYDHLLVKEPGTSEPTPLHHDLPYWPLTGSQILSVWVPLDATSESSGTVQYIAGSHRWGKLFAPKEFSQKSGFSKQYSEMGLEPVPDLDSISAEHRRICWNTEPGDVIVHHPLTLHFAAGNSTSDRRRRAIALRYTGDDARYSTKPGTFIQNPKLKAIADAITLNDGDPLGGALFPRVLPDTH